MRFFSKLIWYYISYLLPNYLLKILFSMLTDRADEVIWHFFAHLLVAADSALPYCFALGSCGWVYWLWLGLDLILVICISAGWRI